MDAPLRLKIKSARKVTDGGTLDPAKEMKRARVMGTMRIVNATYRYKYKYRASIVRTEVDN